ncbi:MAG: class II glutamine amidotransferase [Lachnospiraceae bacterium]|nr:class II glutamine amidotransferase [Lachnospiraceae bacterium]
MCELFALDTKYPVNATEYLRDFFSHSTENPHGWGLAQPSEQGCILEKEPMMAAKSQYLKARLSGEFRSSLLMAHIRYATIGSEEYNNCHPFTGTDNTGRQWTLMHNGTIFHYSALNRFLHTQQGRTDSERIFLHLLDQLNQSNRRKRKLSREERFEVVDSVVRKMAKGNKLNLVIYDGEILYVHTNEKHTLFTLETDEGRLFATKPLLHSTVESKWKPVPLMQVLAYNNGRLIREGQRHSHDYVYDPKHYEELYLAYSEL